jgi:hypothetical protein
MAHDLKVDVFVSFFNLLYLVRVRRGGEYKLWWAPSKRGFDIRSFYSVIVCNDDIHFPWNNFLQTMVPLRAGFFAWSATLGKILTWTTFGSDISLWSIGTVCARRMESLWIIFCSIERLHVLHIMYFYFYFLFLLFFFPS